MSGLIALRLRLVRQARRNATASYANARQSCSFDLQGRCFSTTKRG